MNKPIVTQVLFVGIQPDLVSRWPIHRGYAMMISGFSTCPWGFFLSLSFCPTKVCLIVHVLAMLQWRKPIERNKLYLPSRRRVNHNCSFQSLLPTPSHASTVQNIEPFDERGLNDPTVCRLLLLFDLSAGNPDGADVVWRKCWLSQSIWEYL